MIPKNRGLFAVTDEAFWSWIRSLPNYADRIPEDAIILSVEHDIRCGHTTFVFATADDNWKHYEGDPVESTGRVFAFMLKKEPA